MPITKTKKKPAKQGLSRLEKQITQESSPISLAADTHALRGLASKWRPSRKISFLLGLVSGVALMSILIFIALSFIFSGSVDLPSSSQSVSGEGYWISMLEDSSQKVWVPDLPQE